MLPSPPGLDRQRGQARPPTLSLHCARNDARWSVVTVNGRQREACWQSADGPMQLATDLIGLSKAERALGGCVQFGYGTRVGAGVERLSTQPKRTKRGRGKCIEYNPSPSAKLLFFRAQPSARLTQALHCTAPELGLVHAKRQHSAANPSKSDSNSNTQPDSPLNSRIQHSSTHP